MHKTLVLYPYPQDEKKFRPYYETVHLSLVAKLPGLRAYRHSFDNVAPDGSRPFYCIFEAEYPDADTARRAMQSPAGKAVVEDTVNFETTRATVVGYDVPG